MSCTYRNSLLESDKFYIFLHHSLSVIQVPLDIFATYIILTKTPKFMRNAKFSMLLLHLTSTWYDIVMTILTVPVFFFPIQSAYTLGLVNFFPVPPAVLAYIGFTSIFLLGSSIIVFFENRYNYLVRYDSDSRSRKIQRAIHHFINYTVALTVFLPAVSNVLPQGNAQEIAHRRLFCLPSEVYESSKMIMLGVNILIVLTCLVFYAFSVFLQIIFFFSGTSSYIFKTKSRSKKTETMQKQFFKALCIQVSIPLIIVIIPFCYIVYTTITENFNMALSNLAVFWITTHGFFSTVVMLWVHKSYRVATKEVWKCQKV